METILYQYSFDALEYLLLHIPAVVGIAFILFSVSNIEKKKDKESLKFLQHGKRSLPTALAVLFIIPGIIGILLSGVTAYNFLCNHNTITERIASDDVYVVEGYVENFHPMPAGGHDVEHFEINGVYFEYSDLTLSNAYHKSLPYGGVITHNGQYLRIKYITYTDVGGVMQNHIVYISEVDK